MKRTFIVLLGLLCMGLFANSALAVQYDPGNGFIEVCKNSTGSPAVTGSFAFRITDSLGNVSNTVVPVGLCSAPLPVKAGAATVTELGSLTGLTNGGLLDSAPHREFVKVASVSAVGPSGPITPGPVTNDPWSYTVNVPVSSSNAGTVTITFNDQLVQGYIEVCKAIVAGSGLTGSWSFTLTGANGFSLVQSVPANACSDPILLPAGVVKAQETGDLAENVTAITATQGASPPVDVTVGPNSSAPLYSLATATTVAKVTAATDPSNQTLITFTNDSVRLKVCKYIDHGLTNVGPYSFSFTGNTITGAAPGTLSLPAGTAAAPNCQIVGTYRAGTVVGVTEAVAPGTKVGSITVNNANSVTNSSSLPNKTVSVTLGAGETVVTYEDIPALNGALKLCKGAGTPPPIGAAFAFTVTATGVATQTASVPVGSCVTLPLTYPFNSTVTIVETPSTGNAVTSISATPAFVTVLEGGVATATSQAVLASQNTSTGTATVIIGENDTTEVTYINHDPPVDGGSTGGSTGSTGGSTGSTGGSTGGSTVSSTSGGSSSGGGSSSSSSTPATTSVPALTTVPTSVGVGVVLGSSSTTSATAAAKAALLKADQLKAAKLKAAKLVKLAKLNKQLVTDKATLKVLVAKHAAAKTLAAKQHLAKQISALKLSEAKLAMQIKQLK